VGVSVGDDRVVTRTGVISDEFWAVVEPVLPTAEGKRGRRWRDHREVLEAIAWRFRTGSPWRDLPEDLVPWQTACKCHRRWSVDGTYAEIFAAVRRARHRHRRPGRRCGRSCCRSTPPACAHISTRQAPEPTPSQGAPSNDKDLPAEPVDHAVGRSRGGLTTKIHALTDQATCPVTVRLTAGQAGDDPQLVPLLDAHDAARTADGVGKDTFRLLADKAYSHPSTRQQFRTRRIPHTIPERTDQNAARTKDPKADDHPHSTPRSTPNVTPSDVASAASNNGAASPPATTNTPSPSSAASSSPHQSCIPAARN
jgi:transposase